MNDELVAEEFSPYFIRVITLTLQTLNKYLHLSQT
jgi:hypothetical protein